MDYRDMLGRTLLSLRLRRDDRDGEWMWTMVSFEPEGQLPADVLEWWHGDGLAYHKASQRRELEAEIAALRGRIAEAEKAIAAL